MIEQINKIRQSLLSRLKEDLKISHPEFVSLLEKGTAQNHYNFQEAKKLLDSPIEPWSELLSLLLDLELGYDFCKVTVENISKENSDRELHFHIRTYAIYIRSTLERLECFVKKIKRKGVVSDIDCVLEFTSTALKHTGLNQERNTAAHGRFTGTEAPIGNVKTEFYWEPHAIVYVDESHLNGWHTSYGNNRNVFINHTQDEFKSFSESLRNVLRFINDSL
jgi:hypothetical protein